VAAQRDGDGRDSRGGIAEKHEKRDVRWILDGGFDISQYQYQYTEVLRAVTNLEAAADEGHSVLVLTSPHLREGRSHLLPTPHTLTLER